MRHKSKVGSHGKQRISACGAKKVGINCQPIKEEKQTTHVEFKRLKKAWLPSSECTERKMMKVTRYIGNKRD